MSLRDSNIRGYVQVAMLVMACVTEYYLHIRHQEVTIARIQ